jgi:hypothetical protein
MSSKSTDLKEIGKHLNENDDVCAAVNVWYDSYHLISTEEFLNCSDGWNVEELLEILNDKIWMLTSARDSIKEYREKENSNV